MSRVLGALGAGFLIACSIPVVAQKVAHPAERVQQSGTMPKPAKEISVNCNAGEDLVQQAINDNVGEPSLLINVRGACSSISNLNVFGNVTIVAPGPRATFNQTIQVFGGNVTLRNIFVCGQYGINVVDPTNLTLDSVLVDCGSFGLAAYKGGSVTVKNSNIRSSGYGILIFNGGKLDISDSTVLSRSSGSTVELDIHSSAVIYNSSIRNTGSSRVAIRLSENSTLRTVGTDIRGKTQHTGRSAASYQFSTLSGQMTLESLSYAKLHDGTSHRSNIVSESRSLVEFGSVGAIEGSVICRSGGTIHGQLDGLNIVGCTQP